MARSPGPPHGRLSTLRSAGKRIVLPDDETEPLHIAHPVTGNPDHLVEMPEVTAEELPRERNAPVELLSELNAAVELPSEFNAPGALLQVANGAGAMTKRDVTDSRGVQAAVEEEDLWCTGQADL
jgi:hypothetical protein